MQYIYMHIHKFAMVHTWTANSTRKACQMCTSASEQEISLGLLSQLMMVQLWNMTAGYWKDRWWPCHEVYVYTYSEMPCSCLQGKASCVQRWGESEKSTPPLSPCCRDSESCTQILCFALEHAGETYGDLLLAQHKKDDKIRAAEIISPIVLSWSWKIRILAHINIRKMSEVASTQNTGSITALLHNFYSLLACYDHLSDGWLEILLVYSRQDQWSSHPRTWTRA